MFKEYFEPFREYGVVSKALSRNSSSKQTFEFIPVSIPDNIEKGFKGVDDSPYGGGAGMVMRADALKESLINGVIAAGGYAVDKIKEQLHIVYTAPRGRTWDGSYAREFAEKLSDSFSKDIVFICGRYEGIDERFLENYIDEYISLGDFILTGGELAVMTILDSSLRFVPGVLGNKLSAQDESFVDGKIEYALFTRPANFEGKSVPIELISGDPKKIDTFKENSKEILTKKFRSDLLEG
jgi:tRNA (guanine37-N1)-methyltransferase